jgi:hypothetical protein
MDEILKRKLVYASAFSLVAMLIIVSFFSISLKNVTVNQANKLSNLTHSYYVKSTNLTQLSNKVAQLEANISNLTNKLKLLESKSNSFSLQENLSKSNITAYQKEVNSLNIKLDNLNKSYNTAESLYHLVDKSLSYSLSKLSTDNLSISNLSSELALKNQNISNLSLIVSKLKGSLASDNISLANLSSELALKNQNISNLSSKLNAEYTYTYEENFIPSKITSMKLNYNSSTIRSIAQNGSNLAIVGNKTDPSYFVFIYNVKTHTKTNLTSTFENKGIVNVFSSVSNGNGFTFLVKFKNDSTGLVQYNKNLINLTFFKNYTDFYPVGLAYNNKGYLVTGYNKSVILTTNSVSPPPPPTYKSSQTSNEVDVLLYYNLYKNSTINLSSKLSSFKGYNFTNPIYNGTKYYILGYLHTTNPPPQNKVLNLSLLSYNGNGIRNTLKSVSNLILPIPAGETISQANLSLSWNGAYFLISGLYSTTPTKSLNSGFSNILEIYNPTTNLWANITGSINTKNDFTSNMIWNGTSFITALSNSTESGLYSLNK